MPIPNGRQMQIAVKHRLLHHMSSPPSALGVTYCSRASQVELFIVFVELRDAYSARLNRASLLRLPLPRFCIHFGNYLTITSTSMSTSTSLLQATRQGKIAPGSMPPALALQAKVYWYEYPCLPLPHISARPHRRWLWTPVLCGWEARDD